MARRTNYSFEKKQRELKKKKKKEEKAKRRRGELDGDEGPDDTATGDETTAESEPESE